MAGQRSTPFSLGAGRNFLAASRCATISLRPWPSGSSVPSGAFLAYHADFAEIGRQAGRQAARLLAGAHPSAVPPEKPEIKRLTVNLKAAQALGLTMSWQLLSRAYHLHH